VAGRRPLSVLLHSRAFHPRVGGLERSAATLANAFAELGLDVTVLTDTPLGGAEEVGPYRVVRSVDPATLTALVRNADIVQVNGFSVLLTRRCVLARTPIIWKHAGYQAICSEGNLLHADDGCRGSRLRCFRLSTLHRGGRWAVRRHTEILVRRVLLHAAAANVCVTGWVASRIRAPRSRVIWNPIDLTALMPGSKAPNRGRFSYFGRLVSEKGVLVLLEALALCRRQNHAFTASIVGDGPERALLESAASRLGVADSVRFEGTLTNEPLRRAQSEAWATVIPSLWEEAFGRVAPEAMATGTPLIVSRDGGLREIAEGCALDFANGDALGLALAMAQMGTRPSLWDALAAAGPTRAKLFDARTIAARYASLYEELLA
jgi:glycogen(starch) synthase